VGNDTILHDFANPSFERLVHNPGIYTKLARKGAILAKLAEGQDAIKNLKLAVDCFNLSDRLMDVYWDFQESEHSKIHFVERNYYIYEMALNSLYELFKLTSDEHYKYVAFQLMDKSKARSLRQAVEQAREHARRNIPDSLLSEERNIKSRIASVQNQLSSLDGKEGSDTQEKILNVELIVRQKELEAWKEKLKIKFPQYAFEAKNPAVISLDQLQTQLNNDVIFIEYFFDGKAIYAFASFQGQQRYIKMKGDDLQRNVYTFCSLLSNGLQTKNLQVDFTNYVTLSHKLYIDLVQPIFTSLGVKPKDDLQQMVVIPDGVLSLLPFQALIASKPVRGNVDYKNLDYLVRHYSIAYSFDAASPFASNGVVTKKKLLAFGWSDGIERSVDDLPGTYAELTAIADIIPGKFVMGAKARKKTFLDEAPAYNILHLAIHGVGNAKEIDNNYLQFRDDKLFAHELYGYNFNSNLTVLSACETGYGKVFSAEGVYSIARGFFYAGSRSLLMTLWPINDGDNVPLIREFYKNLEQREHSSKALSASQLDYLERADEYTAHPRFWAGLVLWGSYKEVDEGNKITLLLTSFAVVLLLALAYLLFRKQINKG
jgi:CHAT domain-containing protein